jgi:hypothetical protein
MLQFKQRSNDIRLNTDDTAPAGEYKAPEDGDL